MQKLLLLSFFSFFAAQFCGAQNLVPNPSFEEYTECVNGVAQVCRITDWHVCRSSPDYFNACAPASSQFSVPDNLLGHQYPRTGDAYCGFCTYPNPNTIFINGDYREVLGAQLISPLAIGTKYFISFYVNMSFGAAKIATNKTGVLFSTTLLDSTVSPAPINNFSQFYTDSIITDSVNWVRISGSIVADSAYGFICIGNFFKNANTDTIMYDWPTLGAYYYIDDVCVSTDSLECATFTNLKAQVKEGDIFDAYPNPAVVKITVENIPWDCNEIQIFNVEGKLMQTTPVALSSYKLAIDITALPNGIYTLVIKQEQTIQTKRFIKAGN